MAALFAGSLARSGDLLEVCRAARKLPPPSRPRTVDLVLEGLSMIVTDGPEAAAPALRRAGAIHYERTTGGGSTFCVELPRFGDPSELVVPVARQAVH